MVYVTADLLEVLLAEAARREPQPVTIELAVTPAREFDDLDPDLDPDTPIFTTFYLPGAGGSIEAVFGSKLGTPAGESPGLFVSHPDGPLELERTDDFREVVFVAVPPWDRSSVAAFGRTGQERPLEVLDAEPPEESVP